MASIASIKPKLDQVTCGAGSTVQCSFAVTNTSGKKLTIGADVLVDAPTDKSWFKIIGNNEREFAADDLDQFDVEVTIPADTTAGNYRFRLLVYSTVAPGEDYEEGPTVAIEVPAAKVTPEEKPADPNGEEPFPWLIVGIVGGVILLLVIGVILWLVLKEDEPEKPTGPRIGCDVASRALAAAKQDLAIVQKPATAVLITPTVGANQTPCFKAVQNKIAWNYTGSKAWGATNVNKLCAGAPNSTEPAKCFQQAMHGGVDWGGGTKWIWQNALELCKGTQNSTGRISCFKAEIDAGQDCQGAIKKCNQLK